MIEIKSNESVILVHSPANIIGHIQQLPMMMRLVQVLLTSTGVLHDQVKRLLSLNHLK